MITLEQANEWARKSCPRWNKNKFSRRQYRARYRKAAEEWARSRKATKHGWDPDYPDTYPWPYSDPHFADWEEDGSPEGYNLISDQSGCVVKYATSYVAWKIRELTGKWPQKKTSERLDARRWQQFLAEAGYTEVVDLPEDGHHYVGIQPDFGEWGVVVWFDHTCPGAGGIPQVSTYADKRFQQWLISKPEAYTWVKID